MASTSKKHTKSPVPTFAHQIGQESKISDGEPGKVSELYLILAQTKSTSSWSIARWKSGYAKEPWRTEHNHPVIGKVIAIYELPPQNAREGVTEYTSKEMME